MKTFFKTEWCISSKQFTNGENQIPSYKDAEGLFSTEETRTSSTSYTVYLSMCKFICHNFTVKWIKKSFIIFMVSMHKCFAQELKR